MLVRLLDLSQEFGISPQRLCAGLSWSVEDMRAGQQISIRQAWRMIRRALWLTGRADLGMELGSRQDFSHFGLPGLAMSFARTMGEAVEIGLQYQNQTGALTRTSVEYPRDRVAFVVDSNLPDPSVLPFVMEEYFTSVVGIIQLLVSTRFRLSTLELTYPAPEHAERYRQTFACPVHFGRARNRAEFDRAWLDAPIATHSAVMAAQLALLLEQRARVKAVPPRSTAAVEQLLLRTANARLSIEEVAEALHLSVRTLRRRLREDGTSFRQLCERIRVDCAQRLLREQGMTVAAAAEQLGFSDTRSFRRAFKRWLGQLPGELRATATR
jgi:AraC-like DNA-binding protein